MHTVEKIGGTSMSRFEELMDTILVGKRTTPEELYNRIFVVSAYGGITNYLLEHKKTGAAGVYARFANAESEQAWIDELSNVQAKMEEINAELFADMEFERNAADAFVIERLNDVRDCMKSLHHLCTYGHFQLEEHLMKVREMLASIGEAHSAHNSVLALRKAGINARFVDLTGWHLDQPLPFEEMVQAQFADVQIDKEMVIATGYTHCEEGLMKTFDRGYSEMTFSMIATVTGATEAIIHKEYHLSSADPMLVGTENVVTIGATNYDVADQLSNLGMEAIHPKAAKGLRRNGVKLRIKNAFEPEHEGTVISQDYHSSAPRVEIIAGRSDVFGIEIFDQEMLGDAAYDIEISKLLAQLKLYVINKDADANSITYYVGGSRKMVNRATRLMEEMYPEGQIRLHNLAIVSAIGSHMKVKGILARTVSALAEAGINVMALHQSIRQVEMQCVVSEDDYEKAVIALHAALIEQSSENINSAA